MIRRVLAVVLVALDVGLAAAVGLLVFAGLLYLAYLTGNPGANP